MRALLLTIRAYLAPSAFDQRSRDSERRTLVAELGDIYANRVKEDARESQIVQRLTVISKADSIADAPQPKVVIGNQFGVLAVGGAL